MNTTPIPTPLRGVLLDQATFGDGLDFSRLEQTCDHWTYHNLSHPDDIAARISQAHVVISNKAPLHTRQLTSAHALRYIGIAATGTDHVDLTLTQTRGIAVTNVRGYGTASVAQHVFGLMLSLAGRLPEYHRAAITGHWGQSPLFCLFDHPMTELAGKTLGVVGVGELGRRVIQLAEAFDMRVLTAARPGAAPTADRLALDDMLPQCDVLTLHCPLTEHTRNLINARRLALLPRHAIVINTARGGIINETALANALRNGQLGGAGIDVLTTEPPADGNVLLDPALPNLIVTPHVAWATQAARQRLLDQVADNLIAWRANAPIRQLQP